MSQKALLNLTCKFSRHRRKEKRETFRSYLDTVLGNLLQVPLLELDQMASRKSLPTSAILWFCEILMSRSTWGETTYTCRKKKEKKNQDKKLYLSQSYVLALSKDRELRLALHGEAWEGEHTSCLHLVGPGGEEVSGVEKPAQHVVSPERGFKCLFSSLS